MDTVKVIRDLEHDLDLVESETGRTLIQERIREIKSQNSTTTDSLISSFPSLCLGIGIIFIALVILGCLHYHLFGSPQPKFIDG